MKNSIFIIAEMSANHGFKIEIAKKTIKKAKEVGADAVKIQTYTPDTITIDCDNEYFKIKDGLWKGNTLYDLYKKAYTPWNWHKELFEYAKDIGIILFSTPFDFSAVDLLEELNAPLYKIASFELLDIPLIKYVASMGKPMIMSTGIATFEEIRDAVKACREVGNDDITLLKCTSQYPAKIADANLNTMLDMKNKFNVKVGVSDHTLGSIVPITAASMGAKVIEKHFIIDKKIESPDSSFSMAPKEFESMVSDVRNAKKAMGKVDYSLTPTKKESRKFGRSLFVVKDIKKGEVIDKNNIRSIRPGYGIKPKYYEKVLDKIVKKDVKRGTPLSWDFLK
ncbi:MAG: pseudaminic acid synthase [Fusobacteriota bacterium]